MNSDQEREYRALLKTNGIPVEIAKTAIGPVCRRFTESDSLHGSDVNLVALLNPEVVEAFRLGVAKVDGHKVLLLPPVREVLDHVRDALLFEADAGQRRWAPACYDAIRSMAENAGKVGLELGPYSTVVAQDKIASRCEPDVVFSKGKVRHERTHPHDVWRLIRAPILSARMSGPTFLAFDLCQKCGVTTRSSVRLGVPIIPTPIKHTHRWTPFRVPAPDDKGFFGEMTGETCLVSMGGSTHPGVCTTVRNVKFTEKRRPVLMPPPPWTKLQDPILRSGGFKLPKGHVHLWDEGRISLGASANLVMARCLTCGDEYWSNTIRGQTMPTVMQVIQKVVAPWGGFAKAPSEVLEKIGAALKARFGEAVDQYSDALSMISCVRAPTERDQQVAEDVALRGLRQRELEQARAAVAAGVWPKSALEGLEDPKPTKGWKKARFVVDELDEDADKTVRRTVSGKILDDRIAIWPHLHDDGFEVAHLATRRRLCLGLDRADAMRAAEEFNAAGYVPGESDVQVDLVKVLR